MAFEIVVRLVCACRVANRGLSVKIRQHISVADTTEPSNLLSVSLPLPLRHYTDEISLSFYTAVPSKPEPLCSKYATGT